MPNNPVYSIKGTTNQVYEMAIINMVPNETPKPINPKLAQFIKVSIPNYMPKTVEIGSGSMSFHTGEVSAINVFSSFLFVSPADEQLLLNI